MGRRIDKWKKLVEPVSITSFVAGYLSVFSRHDTGNNDRLQATAPKRVTVTETGSPAIG